MPKIVKTAKRGIMKIQIDTKEDSHEEIRKVIRMLSSLVGEQEVVSNQGNIFADNSRDNGSNNQTADIFGMLNSDANSGANESTLSNEKKDEKDDDVSIDIEEYL